LVTHRAPTLLHLWKRDARWEAVQHRYRLALQFIGQAVLSAALGVTLWASVRTQANSRMRWSVAPDHVAASSKNSGYTITLSR
jgi:hypothetical protein